MRALSLALFATLGLAACTQGSATTSSTGSAAAITDRQNTCGTDDSGKAYPDSVSLFVWLSWANATDPSQTFITNTNGQLTAGGDVTAFTTDDYGAFDGTMPNGGTIRIDYDIASSDGSTTTATYEESVDCTYAGVNRYLAYDPSTNDITVQTPPSSND